MRRRPNRRRRRGQVHAEFLRERPGSASAPARSASALSTAPEKEGAPTGGVGIGSGARQTKPGGLPRLAVLAAAS